MKRGKLLVISGPSGCGKSTVIGKMMAGRENVEFSVSATTRRPRPGEREGVDYFFVSRERFEEMLRNDELLEHAEFVGNCYGTPKSQVCTRLESGVSVILDIEVQGAAQVKQKLPEAITVFLAPPGLDALERRLRGRRTESEETIRARLDTARRGMESVMMLYPPMASLVDKVGSRYLLVNLVARRARQIANEAEENGEILDKKPVSMAIDEVYSGKLTLEKTDD